MIRYVRRHAWRAVISAIAMYGAFLVLALFVLLAGCATNGDGLISEHAAPNQCIRWEHPAPGITMARQC